MNVDFVFHRAHTLPTDCLHPKPSKQDSQSRASPRPWQNKGCSFSYSASSVSVCFWVNMCQRGFGKTSSSIRTQVAVLVRNVYQMKISGLRSVWINQLNHFCHQNTNSQRILSGGGRWVGRKTIRKWNLIITAVTALFFCMLANIIPQNNWSNSSLFLICQGLQAEKRNFDSYSTTVNTLFKMFPPSPSLIEPSPGHCRTCAVVGNSGNLLGSHYGPLIDFNDVIIR